MDNIEKARIRMEKWISHHEHHLKDYKTFAAELREYGEIRSAANILEMVELMSKSQDCLRNALKALDE